jgi:hypothetical protein
MRRPVLAALLACLVPAAPRPALAAAFTVREPAYGLPHFFADTDLELARENGREIARDRLGQLILVARVGRGTLAQAFGSADAGFVDDDVFTRATGYSSSELNSMWAKLPERERELILEYCRGVNDTIDAIYAGALPEPLEVTLLRFLGFGDDLFGNATAISDQIDLFYRAPGGADPERPHGGFQFTPEMAVSIAVLQVRNFGFISLDEPSRLSELQRLVALHGEAAGTQIWEDLNFLVDPLAPVSVPDPSTPGFGGPLAATATRRDDLARRPRSAPARLAARFPALPWAEASRRRAEQRAARAARARRLGAWPMLGSYAWVIAASRSATGPPWVGGFPQTGILTPSIMHFAENRSREGVGSVGMEFVGAPLVLIGQTDRAAWTTTTAQLPVVDAFLEEIVSEDADLLRYSDEGVPAPLARRTERVAKPGPDRLVTVWRTHERTGNGGSRPVLDFEGDAEGGVDAATATTLVDAGAFSPTFAGGTVALVEGPGAGQIRRVTGNPDASTLVVAEPWTALPGPGSVYVAAREGGSILALTLDSATWLEESTTALGFAAFQRAGSVLDVRAGARLMPSTHNFLAADSLDWNGLGTHHGFGNIGYWSSGFSRVRRDGTDLRLPLDGSAPSPFAVVRGSVASASAETLGAPGAFAGLDLAPPPVNARYDDPSALPTEFIVCITSGAGYKQTRRIAANDADTLTLESPWGAVPAPGDTFEVQEILGMPEAVNPSQGYTANWNNKAATLDPGEGFGREHRVTFILERLAADAAWSREKQRQLNADLAGLDDDGRLGRFLLPRLRQAVGPDPHPLVTPLETHDGPPEFGRHFVAPVADTGQAGEVATLEALVGDLSAAIFSDELGVLGVPRGRRGLALVQHALDAGAGDVPGAYPLAFGGDYFDGEPWPSLLSRVAGQRGLSADRPRGVDRYVHPLAGLLGGATGCDDAATEPLVFECTPEGNRGVWEQIVEVGPTVQGEFIFPLGQSGHLEGDLGGASFVHPDAESLQPIWRDWRFLPMLPVARDLADTGSADPDGDGVLDAFERWYFGDTSPQAADDADADGLDLSGELAAGSDPTDPDTDGDGLADGRDRAPQDRLVVPEPGSGALALAALGAAAGLATRRRLPNRIRILR